MAATIASSAVRTCFGDGPATFGSLLRGEVGAGPLRYGDRDALRVVAGHHAEPGPGAPDGSLRAAALLHRCVVDAVAAAGLRPSDRVLALVGTGLGEFAAVEEFATTGHRVPARRLHFADAVRTAAPAVGDVITLSGACSAGGHALALAQDLVELGDADAVVVAGTDTMSRSMLAMIGRVGSEPTTRVRPFDRDRTGVLLGEGAAALVVVARDRPGPALGTLLATGLSCDAFHATAPDPAGIARSMRDAFHRADRAPADVRLVLAHGTGTALNDPVECAALHAVVRAAGGDPLVTGVKGAVGHTSGAAALVNVDVALRCLRGGVAPAVTGLREPLDEGTGLRLVTGTAAGFAPGLVQSDAFGFGGVNAVTLLEPA